METFGDAKMLAGQTQNVALGHKKPQNPHQTAPDTMLKRKVEAFSYQSLHSRGRGHGSPKDLSFRMETHELLDRQCIVTAFYFYALSTSYVVCSGQDNLTSIRICLQDLTHSSSITGLSDYT